MFIGDDKKRMKALQFANASRSQVLGICKYIRQLHNMFGEIKTVSFSSRTLAHTLATASEDRSCFIAACAMNAEIEIGLI